MSLHICLIATVIIPISVCKTLDCTRKNILCNNIKTAGGFRFLYECVTGLEVSAYYNQTVIANAEPQQQKYNFSPEVISMDNSSVVTRECRDLRIKCILPNGNYVEEACEEFIIAEGITITDMTTPWGLIFGAFGVIMIIGMLCWCWKKKPKYLQSCCCHRKGISKAERKERKGTRPHEGCEVQNITTHHDNTTSHNDFSLVERPFVTEPRGSGENDMKGNEQNNTFGAVHVHRVHPKADDKTPQTRSLVCNLDNVKIQPTKNGHICDLDDSRTFHHKVMNRNLKDDPGGVNTVRTTMDMNNGYTQGDCGQEGRPLLLDQRAAVQGSDMAGKAVALVYKRGFDPDQVSRCSTALDTDVESTPKMKNCSIHKY